MKKRSLFLLLPWVALLLWACAPAVTVPTRTPTPTSTPAPTNTPTPLPPPPNTADYLSQKMTGEFPAEKWCEGICAAGPLTFFSEAGTVEVNESGWAYVNQFYGTEKTDIPIQIMTFSNSFVTTKIDDVAGTEDPAGNLALSAIDSRESWVKVAVAIGDINRYDLTYKVPDPSCGQSISGLSRSDVIAIALLNQIYAQAYPMANHKRISLNQKCIAYWVSLHIFNQLEEKGVKLVRPAQ